MQRRATGRPARLCNLRISAPRPANLSPPPWGSGIVRAPVRAGRFREACRKWGQEAVSDLWSGDRHYVSQASAVKLGRGNPHGSLLRTRKYRWRAPRGRLKKSKNGGRTASSPRAVVDRPGRGARPGAEACVRQDRDDPDSWRDGSRAPRPSPGQARPGMTSVGVGMAGAGNPAG